MGLDCDRWNQWFLPRMMERGVACQGIARQLGPLARECADCGWRLLAARFLRAAHYAEALVRHL